jgi:hypothetical protein
VRWSSGSCCSRRLETFAAPSVKIKEGSCRVASLGPHMFRRRRIFDMFVTSSFRDTFVQCCEVVQDLQESFSSGRRATAPSGWRRRACLSAMCRHDESRVGLRLKAISIWFQFSSLRKAVQLHIFEWDSRENWFRLLQPPGIYGADSIGADSYGAAFLQNPSNRAPVKEGCPAIVARSYSWPMKTPVMQSTSSPMTTKK